MYLTISPEALRAARTGQCVGDKTMQADGTIAPTSEPSRMVDYEREQAAMRAEADELAKLRRELADLKAKPQTGIVATFGKVGLVRGEYKGDETLGLYPLADDGTIKRARDGEQYPIKGHCHCLSWWREHDAAIRALLDAAKEV